MSKATPYVKWFPADFLNGVADLEPNEVCVYVIILNMIYDKQAPIPCNVPMLARRCRMRPTSFQNALDVLIDAGKLELHDRMLMNRRAAIVIESRREVGEKLSEAASSRWKKGGQKDKKNNEGDDALAMPRERVGNASQSHSPEIKVQKKKATPKKAPPAPKTLKLDGGPDKTPARMAVDLYNEVAARIGGRKAEDLTDARRKRLNARMNGRGFAVWQEAMERVEKSHFLCGETKTARGERPFQLHIDMLLRPDNFQRLMEGFYGEDRDPAHHVNEGPDPRTWSAARWERVLEVWTARGEWNEDAGPEPGQPGYLGPATGDDYVHQ